MAQPTGQSWIKTVTADEIIDEKSYFWAVERDTQSVRGYAFYSQDIKGKNCLSSKPGFAMHVVGNNKLRKVLRERTDHITIEIPSDFELRWKRRKRG
ncbi:hypothetical protein HQN60_01235 [Deefgea piscis]|uniref:Uncharacterized protein n=1 Tax=Deefgea piscis TaxID=2739061 RepID=A0A6M8SUB6_9NEIS|nr:hypothetical protein [Deefgea piscis]QKJ65467.1 hypothetical protein HQN60_01235 [Deefgea piscis]